MTDDQLKKIISGQQRIESQLRGISIFVAMTFVMTVVMPAITPILKHFGWWNMFGWPE